MSKGNSYPWKIKASCLGLLIQMAVNQTVWAEVSCADLAKPVMGSGASHTVACDNFEECSDEGKRLLKEGASDQATDAFKKALSSAIRSKDKQQALACLGIAYESTGNVPWALAAVEKARSVHNGRLSWIENAYKRLLSTSNQNSMTAEGADQNLEKKQLANKEIESLAGDNPPTVVSEVIPDEPPAQPVEGGESPRLFKTPVGVSEAGVDVVASIQESRPPSSNHKPLIVKKHPKPTKSKVNVCRSAGSTSLAAPVQFDFGSAELTAQGQETANGIGKFLEKALRDNNTHALLTGHTDQLGTEEENKKLSIERASAVKDYLVGHFPSLNGKQDRISTLGLGMSQLLFCETDEESRALNRRVEIKLQSSN